MREILFRGKRPNSGKWIEGYLYQENGLSWILSSRFKIQDCSCEVISESVGQFTGLTDKNGKKIFEGDILQYKSHISYIMDSCIMLVKFDDSLSCFGYESLDQKWIHPFTLHDELQLDVLNHCEVIGNIHDNPELLK